MFSKSQIKLITSLALKKYRTKHNFFFAEGIKVISELLESSFILHSLYTTENLFVTEREKVIIISEADLRKISQLKTPQTALAIFYIPEMKITEPKGLILVLDGIRDPGNLGTIIRLCDWFGVEQLVCSKDTVDCFNPKVVQATMGSIARVSVSYLHLQDFISENPKLPVYGAYMEGENVLSKNLSSDGILLMGNEANGISTELEGLVNEKISIPRYGRIQETESLNVAAATAILLSEFRRSSIEK